MKAFVWDCNFETGIANVDKQHGHLVDLINLAGNILLDDKVAETKLQALFEQLADYAIYHFNEEESLMAKHFVDSRHVEAHKKQHAEFLNQVTLMWHNRNITQDAPERLHDFLSSWLTVHILGQDQEMARILQRMTEGAAASAAYDAERQAEDHRITPLLDALHRLYIVLSRQNRDLADANTNLENKVLERTRDLEEAREHLIQSEKLASLGRMVAGFAHEINTPIGVALGSISQNEDILKQLEAMINQEEASEEEFTELVTTLSETDKLALSNLRRAEQIVRSFKRTSIDQISDQFHEFNVVDLIRDVIATLRNQFSRTRVEIILNCPDHLIILGVPGFLEQILTNLLLNSLHHGFEDGKFGGNIHIKVSVVQKAKLKMIFSDNGAGMTQDVANKIFEPFFTTARGKGGSGLGLYICYNIVTVRLNGSISVSSSPEQGTEFIIDFPIQQVNSQDVTHEVS